MEIHDRLKQAREAAGFSSGRQAAKALSVAPATYTSHENGERGIPKDRLEQYARRFKVTPEWLMFGTMPRDPNDPNLYSNAEYTPLPSATEDAPYLQRVEPGEDGPTGNVLVPVFDLHASAGYGAVVDQEAEVYSLAFPPAYLKRLTSSSPGNLAIISVKGESMEPTLLDDDIVLLDASKTNLSYDGLFVLRFNDALHVKRIGRSYRKGHITIISDNKDLYPQIEAPVDEIEAVGKVLWYGRKV